MTVAVQGRQPQEDGLTKIARGLQVAQGILGIKQSFDDAALKREQAADIKAERERKQKGILNPLEVLSVADKVQQVDPSTPGAMTGFSTPTGQQIAFASRKAEMTPYEAAQDANRRRELDLKEQELTAKKSTDSRDRNSKNIADATSLHNKWFDQSKNTKEAWEGFRKVEAAATKKNPTGADDIALVYGYMKAIDPTSSVKEGEYDEAKKSAAIPDQIWTLYENLVKNKGRKLSESARQDLYHSALNQIQAVLKNQEPVDQYYTGVAKDAGYKLEHVVEGKYGEALKEINEKLSKIGPTEPPPVENVSQQNSQEPVIGMIYTNERGQRAKFLGNDRWEPVGPMNARK